VDNGFQSVISTGAEESREAGAWGRVERSRRCVVRHADTRNSPQALRTMPSSAGRSFGWNSLNRHRSWNILALFCAMSPE